ncbi:tetratricopeptide repeat protein [Streptomyces sp. CHD11]|uniref:tetratricopeptide repeat protein n=1 Tax=Streptomyces sp. CHD11 TaxID=2741325 RepID=UPI001BFC28B6|nr:tetratricopeptide repeat protein [Streptomyces sp. CHD11]MBT3151663.1 tetratricopeptide repeat protein [Streptomyces sp. CHD11]
MTNPLAGMLKARQKEAARPALYARGMRVCGEYLAARDDRTAPCDVRLTRAVGVLAAALGTPSADPFDALLQVGERALETGGEDGPALALGIAETATELRQRSRGAWRLRGRALDRLGRDEEALECYGRCLALHQGGDTAEAVTRRTDTLRRRRECLEEAAALLPVSGRALERLTAGDTGTAAGEFAAQVRARMAEHGPGDRTVRRLLELYGTYRRLVERSALPDPLLGGSVPIGAGGLRALVAGRTVCVVSDAREVADSTLGAEIDGYDLVVRCDAFRLRAEGTGGRTGLHAVSLRGDTPWEGPSWSRRAGIRLVFGDPAGTWRRATRERLVAGAQDQVGDASLRRPLSDPALLGEDGWGAGASTAFTVLRLLDFLDVSPRLDLIGFDRPGRLRPAEAAWVMERATHVDAGTMRISLR